jgi:hypothetical protein
VERYLMTNDEVNWRDEFAKVGATKVRENLPEKKAFYSQPKRICALKWLREQECAAQVLEQGISSYTRRTFWAAVAAVIVGIIGIVATLLH